VTYIGAERCAFHSPSWIDECSRGITRTNTMWLHRVHGAGGRRDGGIAMSPILSAHSWHACIPRSWSLRSVF
jgi:hypothetical protein